MLIVALAVVMCSAGAQATDTPAGTARVRGVVINADSGAPIVRATVRLSSPGSAPWEGTSDAAGRFEVAGLPAGRYSVTARRAGFVLAVAESGARDYASRSLELHDGQTVDDVTVRMFRGGAIEGRVSDENGEPLVEANIRALRAEYIAGGRRLTARHTVLTDDRGRYRLHGLPPGKYFVVSALRSLDLATHDTRKPPQVMRGASGFAPTFYPGTPVAADAQPVTVRAGQDAVGVDFSLTAVRLARITGTVADSRGRPAAGYVVMLNPARIGGAVVTASAQFDMMFVEPSADGSFVLTNVRPGEYRLDVRSKAALEAVARSGASSDIAHGPEVPEYASVPITVNGEDVDGLRVLTTAGRRMSGRIAVNGAAATPGILRRLRVSTDDITAGPGVSAVMLSSGAAVEADGTFEVPGVSGTRAITVSGLPDGWALLSVRASGLDVTDDGIHVGGSDVTDVEVTITATPARIRAAVVDGVGRPVMDSAVVAFAEDRSRWASPPNRHVASTRAAPDGTYRLTVPAGGYFLAVVDELVDGEWAEPENLERLSAVAVRVKLADGESKAVTLRR